MGITFLEPMRSLQSINKSHRCWACLGWRPLRTELNDDGPSLLLLAPNIAEDPSLPDWEPPAQQKKLHLKNWQGRKGNHQSTSQGVHNTIYIEFKDSLYKSETNCIKVKTICFSFPCDILFLSFHNWLKSTAIKGDKWWKSLAINETFAVEIKDSIHDFK